MINDKFDDSASFVHDIADTGTLDLTTDDPTSANISNQMQTKCMKKKRKTSTTAKFSTNRAHNLLSSFYGLFSARF